MLYDRDYRKLTEEEVSVWKKVEELFNKSKRGGIISPAALHKYWDDLPCAVVHYKQLFPNNYIIPSQLRQKYNPQNRLFVIPKRNVSVLRPFSKTKRLFLKQNQTAFKWASNPI